jgi:hypothetical protein
MQKNQFHALFYLDDSIFQNIFKKQITDLILHNNDERTTQMSLKTYFTNVYERTMVLFQNLKTLKIDETSANDYPLFSYCLESPTTYFSSTLTVLCIIVCCFGDCLSLLDGHLKQLTTFIVQIRYIGYPLNFRNMVS